MKRKPGEQAGLGLIISTRLAQRHQWDGSSGLIWRPILHGNYDKRRTVLNAGILASRTARLYRRADSQTAVRYPVMLRTLLIEAPVQFAPGQSVTSA